MCKSRAVRFHFAPNSPSFRICLIRGSSLSSPQQTRRQIEGFGSGTKTSIFRQPKVTCSDKFSTLITLARTFAVGSLKLVLMVALFSRPSSAFRAEPPFAESWSDSEEKASSSCRKATLSMTVSTATSPRSVTSGHRGEALYRTLFERIYK